jgi:hypothetical protein
MAAQPLLAELCSFRFALPLICRFGQRLSLPSISPKTDILLCRMDFCLQDSGRKPLFDHAPIFDGLRAGLATKDSFKS